MHVGQKACAKHGIWTLDSGGLLEDRLDNKLINSSPRSKKKGYLGRKHCSNISNNLLHTGKERDLEGNGSKDSKPSYWKHTKINLTELR